MIALSRYLFVSACGIHALRSCRSSRDCLEGTVFTTGELLVGRAEYLRSSGIVDATPKLSERDGGPIPDARDGVSEERRPVVRHSGGYWPCEPLRRISSSGLASGHGESETRCP